MEDKKWDGEGTPKEGQWTDCPNCGDVLVWVNLGNEGEFFSCQTCDLQCDKDFKEIGSIEESDTPITNLDEGDTSQAETGRKSLGVDSSIEQTSDVDQETSRSDEATSVAPTNIDEDFDEDRYDAGEGNDEDNDLTTHEDEEEEDEEGLNDEAIEVIRGIAEDKEILHDKDKKSMNEQRIKASSNPIALAQLYMQCYDILANNADSFSKPGEEDYGKRLKNYLVQFDLNELRDATRGYGGGFNFGDNYREKDIEAIVYTQREQMVNLINTFFRVFAEV